MWGSWVKGTQESLAPFCNFLASLKLLQIEKLTKKSLSWSITIRHLKGIRVAGRAPALESDRPQLHAWRHHPPAGRRASQPPFLICEMGLIMSVF